MDSEFNNVNEIDTLLKQKGFKSLNNVSKIKNVNKVKTNIEELDTLLNGGWPQGKVIELYGSPSSGKSTLSYISIASLQKQNYTNILIDTENSFTSTYGYWCGINLNTIGVYNPDSLEEAFEVIRLLVNSKCIDFIWVDTLAALSLQSEIQSGYKDETPIELARKLDILLRSIIKPCNDNQCSVIWLNQTRMLRSTFDGDKNFKVESPGGGSLKHLSALRLYTEPYSLGSYEKKYKGDYLTKIKVIKSKLDIKPHSETFIPLYEFDENNSRPYEF